MKVESFKYDFNQGQQTEAVFAVNLRIKHLEERLERFRKHPFVLDGQQKKQKEICENCLKDSKSLINLLKFGI